MSPDVQTHLFGPFFTTRDETKGTGLGLSTVYRIVRESGGQIIVETESNKGTTFEIFLPRESP
jgi:two-component system, cell cycle sensor histidine kinase and response regulator CckA